MHGPCWVAHWLMCWCARENKYDLTVCIWLVILFYVRLIACISKECLIRIYDQIVLMTCLVHLQSLRPCAWDSVNIPEDTATSFWKDDSYIPHATWCWCRIKHNPCDGRGWYVTNHRTTRDAQQTQPTLTPRCVTWTYRNEMPSSFMVPLGQRQRKTFRSRHFF